MTTNQRNVLVVDDEAMILESISAYLGLMGYRVYTADNGREALKIFADKEIDFVILDLMLPGMSGEEICSEIRKNSNVPIIMLTAKQGESDILNGLKMGADDYVTKPFSVKELGARMEAVLRRTSEHPMPLASKYSWNDDLLIDFEHNEIKKAGKAVNLTPSEWKIMTSLVRYPKKVFSRDELIFLAFGEDTDSFDRIIDTHIKNLRKKVETDPRNPVYIKTVHGLGYKFGGDDNL